MTAVESRAVATPFARISPETAPVSAPRARRKGAEVPRTVVTPRATPTLERRLLWEKRYRWRLSVSDSVLVVLAAVLAALVQPLLGAADVVIAAEPVWRVPALTVATWLVVLAAFRTREATITGSGATEYKRVAHATGLAFGVLAIVFIVLGWPGLRSQLMVALPVGLFALLVERWVWRRWLLHKRRYGLYSSRAIVVGSHDDVEYVLRTLDDNGQLGYCVVGITLDDADALTVDAKSYPVVGTPNTVAQVAGELGADTIIVASRPHGEPDYVKRLSWQLEGTAADLLLCSRLTDVAGPRISLRQVDGLPLIRVRIPTFEGGQHVLKRALDVAVASMALALFAPLGLLIALLITLDSAGPVFYSQLRVGRDGREFRIRKFRSMRTGADDELDALIASNEGSGPLFKLKVDPRVTRVGRMLRRYSLDEVPQFWNVLVGDMSVVGPRPPLPTEVTSYDGTVFRRLYIKPGITGLWQVSGRSDLSWHESVRLDLRYVENWSLISDLMIMWRTARVMVQPKGAY